MPVLLSALAGLVGAGLPILTKFLMDFFSARKKSQLDERQDVWNEASKLRQDLQVQLLQLREDVGKLQTDNLHYIVENAELRGKIKALESQVEDLKSDLVARDKDVAQLQSERTTLSQVRSEMEKKTSEQLLILQNEIAMLKLPPATQS
jgi:peptidoglycan hydrolase CwlO-like protein